jgi:Protein of unknown function (DUF4235)
MWPKGSGQIHTSSQAGGIASSRIRSSVSESSTRTPSASTYVKPLPRRAREMPAAEQSARFSRGLRGIPPEMKLIFAPIGIAAGLLAGFLAQKGFDLLWSAFDDEEAPEPDQRDVPYPKLIAALIVEGAVFRLTKGLVDHAVRNGFARTTGRWPGEERSA